MGSLPALARQPVDDVRYQVTLVDGTSRGGAHEPSDRQRDDRSMNCDGKPERR